MKKALLIFAIALSSIYHGQNFKTVEATYIKSGEWGEWSGLIFKTNKGEEMRFLKTTDQDVEIRRFWQNREVTADPEDVSGQIHTNKNCIGQKYLIRYVTKTVHYKGMDEDGSQDVIENVIVTFQPLGGDNINGASSYIYQNGELKAITFETKLYEIDDKGKKRNEKVIQNKNEICKGKTCYRIAIEKDGVFYTLVLPNITDKNIKGKADKYKILKRETDYQGKEQFKSRGITYYGDRYLSVVATLAFSWFQ